MFEINWFDFVVLILASFRITHLLVYDGITEIIRKPFIGEVEKEDSLGNIEVVFEPKGTGIRHFIGSLLSCYWCTGFWVTAGTVLAYFFIPIIYPVLLIFAVAGAAAFIESRIE
jgi:hypothetical protein